MNKGGECMKKKDLPIVHCIYADTKAEKSLPEILEESFRLYLIRLLDEAEQPVVQYKG